LWGFVLQGIMKKLTHEEYIKKWRSKVENPPYKIVGKYKNSRIPILIENKYGKCLINSVNLLKGTVPTIQTAINKAEYCINQFKEIHGDTYDYSQINYIGTINKVKIICTKHGEFKQAPCAHLQGQGCKECKRYSRLDGLRLTTDDFIKKANKVHNNLYSYKYTKVKGNKNKVTITCKEHGNFQQSPNSHLKGRGCRKCYLENNGYNKNKFVYFAKDRICKLYLIKCFNEEECFLKIGITSRNLQKRFYGDNSLPYKYKKILIIENPSAEFIWEKEVELKRKFKDSKYNPKINFKGYTECFSIEKLKEIKMNINKLKL